MKQIKKVTEPGYYLWAISSTLVFALDEVEGINGKLTTDDIIMFESICQQYDFLIKLSEFEKDFLKPYFYNKQFNCIKNFINLHIPDLDLHVEKNVGVFSYNELKKHNWVHELRTTWTTYVTT